MLRTKEKTRCTSGKKFEFCVFTRTEEHLFSILSDFFLESNKNDYSINVRIADVTLVPFAVAVT